MTILHIPGSTKREDLFVFTVRHVTMRKGERVVAAVADFTIPYADVFSLDLPSAARWQGDDYARVELAGTIKLTNYRDTPVDIEVTRHVLGNVSGADNGGIVAKVNVFEDGSYMAGESPRWWRWYSWPNWWPHFNGVGRINWKLRIEPGKSVDLGYKWHYFWR